MNPWRTCVCVWLGGMAMLLVVQLVLGLDGPVRWVVVVGVLWTLAAFTPYWYSLSKPSRKP